MTQDSLRQAVREYVELGGRDAYAFSLTHRSRFGKVPGREIQRMIGEIINEEVARLVNEEETIKHV